MSVKARNKLQEDKAKAEKAGRTNSEKIERMRAIFVDCKVLFDGFVADIDASFKQMSPTELLTNNDNVTQTFTDLTERLLDESIDLDVTISTPR